MLNIVPLSSSLRIRPLGRARVAPNFGADSPPSWKTHNSWGYTVSDNTFFYRVQLKWEPRLGTGWFDDSSGRFSRVVVTVRDLYCLGEYLNDHPGDVGVLMELPTLWGYLQQRLVLAEECT